MRKWRRLLSPFTKTSKPRNFLPLLYKTSTYFTSVSQNKKYISSPKRKKKTESQEASSSADKSCTKTEANPQSKRNTRTLSKKFDLIRVFLFVYFVHLLLTRCGWVRVTLPLKLSLYDHKFFVYLFF